MDVDISFKYSRNNDTLIHNIKIFHISSKIFTNIVAVVCSFCQNLAKLCGAPGFWENVLDRFSCLSIEMAYLNFTFCGAYTLSFLVRHTFQQNELTKE